MNGTIYVNSEVGKALLQRRAGVAHADVLNFSGGFQAGERVYIVMRGSEGGQRLIATGLVRANQAEAEAARVCVDPAKPQSPLVAPEDVQLLWLQDSPGLQSPPAWSLASGD